MAQGGTSQAGTSWRDAVLPYLKRGPVAALLSEMFPPHVRYSSLSIPYHLGTGYFGGFLPLIASFIVAKTGNAYAGLWYTWVVVLVAFLISAFLLKEPVEGEWDKPASAAGDAA